MSSLAALEFTAKKNEVKCKHCSNSFFGVREFCCGGCETVFHILSQSNLTEYYNIKDSTYCFDKPLPINWKNEKFSFLDSPEIQKLYIKNSNEILFFVEGLHCVACIWLLEKLNQLNSNIESSQLDLSQNLLKIRIKNSAHLSQVAELIQNLGYKPHPLQSKDDLQSFTAKENKKNLLRIGVAGAAGGNIMLLAISVYAGADGQLAQQFHWFSFFIFLPVLFYCAQPLYKTAWSTVYSKQISVDVPIVLAILIGSLFSVYSLFTHSSQVYFDSLSMLVFLLLSSRYFLKQLQQKTLHLSNVLQNFIAPVSHLWDGQNLTEVSVPSLQIGDIIKVFAQEKIPADGIITNGESAISTAWLNGESAAHMHRKGDLVFAGSVNEGNDLVIQVNSKIADSRIGQILKQVEQKPSSNILSITDRIGSYFIYIVLSLSALVFLYFANSNWHEGLFRALSLMIVACPCTLALATPLTFSLSLRKAYQNGLVLKSGSTLEKLAQIKNIFFDKTGTLTMGTLTVSEWQDLQANSEQQKEFNQKIAYALEAKSQHPTARALRAYLHNLINKNADLPNLEATEQVGVGVSASYLNNFYEIKSFAENKTRNTCVALYCNQVASAKIFFQDAIRTDALLTMHALQKQQIQTYLLSGDKTSVAKQTGLQCGIKEENIFAEKTPEQKAELLNKHAFSMMVGDGANDALSLKNAHVGVAIHGSMDLSLKIADIYVAKPNTFAIYNLIVLGTETMKILKRNFTFSILYNCIAAFFALTGKITPLMAALIMPLNSLTVLFSCIWATPKFRKIFKQEHL